MKYLKLLLLSIFLMSFQCDDDISLKEDLLIETGLLGTWEIADQTINDIDDLIPKCCLFLEFYPDDNYNDLTGFFSYTEGKTEISQGRFLVDPSEQVIIFSREGKEDRVYTYSMNQPQDILVLHFFEDDASFIQTWNKQ